MLRARAPKPRRVCDNIVRDEVGVEDARLVRLTRSESSLIALGYDLPRDASEDMKCRHGCKNRRGCHAAMRLYGSPQEFFLQYCRVEKVGTCMSIPVPELATSATEAGSALMVGSTGRAHSMWLAFLLYVSLLYIQTTLSPRPAEPAKVVLMALP